MTMVRQGGILSRVNRLGGVLATLSVVTVVVTFPPRATGLRPLLGVGNMFLPLFTSWAALFLAVLGGIFLARGVTEAQPKRARRVLVRVSVPVGTVTVINAYLVTVGGLWYFTSYFLVAVALSIVGGIADEFIG